MSLPSKSANFPLSRKLWLIPFFMGLGALALCCIVPGWFGPYSTLVGVTLVFAEILISIVPWRIWNQAERQLEVIGKELSSLKSIVDVSGDAIINVTTEGIIMSWNSGARSMYGYSAKEA